MKINAVAINLHDHNTYDGVYHNQEKDTLDLNIIYHTEQKLTIINQTY